MGKRDIIGGAYIEDVGGSFARMVNNAPKEARKRLGNAVLVTADKLRSRIAATAPVGPEAPHLRDTVTFYHRGLNANVGYLKADFGGDAAADDSDTTIAEVALYNEYEPNNQPFMKPAAEAEERAFAARAADALQSMVGKF
jgi:hypothetical protein